jgi:signal transduction histidine kinase
MQRHEIPLQEQIDRLHQQLRHAQKMAALGELASTTTHEFNNVLMTILNYAKLGLRHEDKPTRDKALTKILEAAQRAEKVTNGVLGLARNRGTEKSPTDLVALTNQSLVLLEREMNKYRIHVETHFEQTRKANVCGNQIQQVLLNLLTNARQAIGQGGHITIRIAENKTSETVDLSIRDSGSGIPQEKLPKVFDRFYSTKQGPDASGKGGTGLGLSMCRDIIEEHHGRIRVESKLGVGTAFTLMLPVATEEADVTAVPTPKLGIPTQLNLGTTSNLPS